MKILRNAITILLALGASTAAQPAPTPAPAPTPTPPRAPALMSFLQGQSPAEILEVIYKKSEAELSGILESLNKEDRTRFLTIVKTALDHHQGALKDEQYARISYISNFHDPDGILFDALLEKNKCNNSSGGINTACKTRQDGAAYAAWSRTNHHACWKTLKVAKGRPKAFADGVREFHGRQVVGVPGELDNCVDVSPARCKLGRCSNDYSYGLSVRPLTDLGVAVPLGHPDFGFKENQSAALQATAGIGVRGFVWDGQLDLRLGLGFANAVDSDGMTSTVALAWTAQVGAFELLSLGILGLTKPTNADTGIGLAISIDLAGVRDIIEEQSKSK